MMYAAPQSVRPQPSPAPVSIERRNAGRTTYVATVALLVFGALAVHRQWISDDGMIVVREVREILAGAGPNYNPFQRDEVDTSALWSWLLAAFAFVGGGDVAVDAVVLGFVLTLTGLAVALLASRNLHRQLGTTGVLLPVGALVPIAISGWWDFATSGLETGLSVAYLGIAWWLLVSVTAHTGTLRMITVSIIVGLGPLVRPEFAVVTGVFWAAMLIITRPGRGRTLVTIGVGALAPVGYEVFRMGYYGIAVPMPALAKEASSSLWGRGWVYLGDFASAYLLWIPMVALAIIGLRWVRRSAIDRRSAVLLASPVLAAVLLGCYVVRVGGDYMHARMWIPVLFTLLLPVMSLPVGRAHRIESIGAILLAAWALVATIALRPPYHGQEFGPDGIVDERSFETITYAGDSDLTTTSSRLRDHEPLTHLDGAADRGVPTLMMSSGSDAHGPLWSIPMSASGPDRLGFFYDNMGIAAAVTPLDGTVVDLHGLATPLAGHLMLQQRGRPGHEKALTAAWVLAEYADPAAVESMTDGPDVTRAQVRAARHALTCGALKELLDSVDQPMSVRRFWDNLVGALARTELRVPSDPFTAERQFCRSH